MKKAMPKIPMPADMDKQAKRKFREMAEACDPDVDQELLANYARTYSILVSLRAERAKQEAAGVFSTMVAGRDSTQTLNPLIVGENRTIAALNRMLKGLGLTPSKESSGRVTILPTPPPPGFPPDAKEPRWGWTLEQALCSGREPSPTESEADRRRKANEKLLARNDWRAYETDFDGGDKRGK
jgi:phage terminase small subunit